MKTSFFIIQVLFYIICFSNCSLTEHRIGDEQAYGQKPPGNIPEVYDPKFVFIEEMNPDIIDFSPDFKEICYTIMDTVISKQIIYYTKQVKGNWTKPEIAYFVPYNGTGSNPSFSPDGRYFSYSYNGDLWRAIKDGEKWAIAEKMPEPISTDKYECTISFSKSGSIYFAANGRPEGKSDQCDIYFTRYNGTKLDSAHNLGNLNTSRSECSVSVSPNEELIVFTRYFRKQGQNATDLYISFHKEDGAWTIAQNLGPYINSLGSNYSPRFSNDGKYFFFKQGIWSDRLEKYETKKYWVSTKFFDDMRDFVIRSNNLVE